MTASLQRGKSSPPNETICWPWIKTLNDWELLDPGGSAVRDPVIEAVTWSTTFIFGAYLARRTVGETRSDQSAGHVKQVMIVPTVFFKLFLWQINHYHHVVLLARVSPTLSRNSFLSAIASGRSSRQHPVSVQSCCRWVLVGRPTLARPCKGVHERRSVMSSSLLLQLRPACLIWRVLEMGGRWPYRCCFVGCCFQDLLNSACSILVQLPSSFFCIHLLSVYVVHPSK